ncbi:MAG TPA: hypothetical protein VGI39_27765 [Polyangiaceae bacterium]|jgi:hypothetical protein
MTVQEEALAARFKLLVEDPATFVHLQYLEPRIRELAELLGKPEIEQRWLEWKRAGTR